MNWLKAWFTRLVSAKTSECAESIIGAMQEDVKRVVEDHTVSVFTKARSLLLHELETAKADLNKAAADLRAVSLTCLHADAAKKMDEELKAFEARVQHTLEACIKDEPSHWKADEQTKTEEHELRKVK